MGTSFDGDVTHKWKGIPTQKGGHSGLEDEQGKGQR